MWDCKGVGHSVQGNGRWCREGIRQARKNILVAGGEKLGRMVVYKQNQTKNVQWDNGNTIKTRVAEGGGRFHKGTGKGKM